MNPLKMGSAICSMMLQHLNSMEQCPWPLGALKKAKNPETAALFLAQMPALSPASEFPFSAPPDP